jgi:hypothetical protein
MARHLSEVNLVDAAEDAASPDVAAHLQGCADCAARVGLLRSALVELGEGAVLEPSERRLADLRRAIGRRLDAQGGPGASRAWQRWLWVPVAALGAAAVVMVAVGPPAPTRQALRTLPAWTVPAENEDLAMTAVSGLDPSADDVAVVTGDGGVAEQVASLSDDETAALVQALRTEMGGSL